MFRIYAHNVGNPYMMVLVISTACLRAMPISPLKELIVVKDHLLIDALEEQAIVRRAARRFNLKWKVQ